MSLYRNPISKLYFIVSTKISNSISDRRNTRILSEDIRNNLIIRWSWVITNYSMSYFAYERKKRVNGRTNERTTPTTTKNQKKKKLEKEKERKKEKEKRERDRDVCNATLEILFTRIPISIRGKSLDYLFSRRYIMYSM